MAITLQSLMNRKTVPKQWGGFLKAVRAATFKESPDHVRKDAHKALEDMGAKPVHKAQNQVESQGIYGGYAVPPDFNLSVSTSYEEEVFLYPRATVVPMLSRTTSLPRVNAETAQSVGVPPWWGGMTFSWGTSSTGAITQTNPTLAQNQLVAKNLIGTIYASQDLAQDIGNGGEEFLFNMFARGAAWNEEFAFFQGLGNEHQPLGILTSSGTKSVARKTTNHINQQDFGTMAAALTPRGWAHAIWACSPSSLLDIVQTTAFIPNQNVEGLGISAAGSLLSRPLFVTDKLPAIAVTGSLLLFDPTQYLIGDRAELIVQVSDEQLFTTNQVVYRVWRRVDGSPLFSSAITLPDAAATTTSPFVALLA